MELLTYINFNNKSNFIILYGKYKMTLKILLKRTNHLCFMFY